MPILMERQSKPVFSSDELKTFYLDFTNDYLSIETFTDRMNSTVANITEELPVTFWQSVVNRGAVQFLIEMVNTSKTPFIKTDVSHLKKGTQRLHHERLLREASA